MQVLIDVLLNYPDPLKRPPETKVAISEALESIQFFADFLKSEKIKSNTRHLLQEFSNYLQLELYKANDIIFKEGDKGEKFYIILQGIVNVYRQEVLQEKKEYDNQFDQCNQKIGQIKEGGTFGELALTLNKPRFATIRALTPVILCALSKENYAKMTNYMERQIQIKTTALSQIFPKLSQNSLVRLAYLMQIQTYPKNHYIFKQGQAPSGFYIIFEGEVRLEQVRREKLQIFVPIVVLTAGSLFGVQEVIMKQNYDHNAQCISQKVTLYKFPADSFEQFGNELGQKVLMTATKATREPKLQSMKVHTEPTKKISLRKMAEENLNENNHKKPNVIKSLAYGRNLISSHKQKKNSQDAITFRNPFFADLDADNFKQIKKISIEKERQTDLKRYNEQFSVHKFFDPIDMGKLMEPMVKNKEINNPSFSTQRSQNVYSYPASGYITQRQKINTNRKQLSKLI